MGFYEEKLVPVIREVCGVIEETPHMQDIVKGTMPYEKFRFQIKQNYNQILKKMINKKIQIKIKQQIKRIK